VRDVWQSAVPWLNHVPMSWLTDRRLFAAALAVWVWSRCSASCSDRRFGHDEAAFAIAAAVTSTGAWLYRSEGTIAIARSGSRWAARRGSCGDSVVLSGLAIVAVYASARGVHAADRGVGGGRLAGAHPMVLRSAELLSDLPAMAGVLCGIALLAGELDRDDGPRWRIALAGPIFAAAFYMRYASAPVVNDRDRGPRACCGGARSCAVRGACSRWSACSRC